MYIEDGQLARHLKRLRKHYRFKGNHLLNELKKAFPNHHFELYETALKITMAIEDDLIDYYIETAKRNNINVTKTANLDTANTNLETLAIENVLLNPPFDNTITHYNIEVSNSTTQLNILAVPENENASTSISGNNDLKEGNNQIVVSVIASNGFTKKDFIINAYKRNAQEEEQFISEQEMQQEKLEEAYEIEQTSKLEENISEEANNNKWYIIGGIIVIIIVISIIGIIYFKKKRSGNK